MFRAFSRLLQRVLCLCQTSLPDDLLDVYLIWLQHLHKQRSCVQMWWHVIPAHVISVHVSRHLLNRAHKIVNTTNNIRSKFGSSAPCQWYHTSQPHMDQNTLVCWWSSLSPLAHGLCARQVISPESCNPQSGKTQVIRTRLQMSSQGWHQGACTTCKTCISWHNCRKQTATCNLCHASMWEHDNHNVLS